MPLHTAPLPSLIDASSSTIVDFISDVHLSKDNPEQFAIWRRYLLNSPAQTICILGDLFDLWLGDDILQHPEFVFEQQCTQILAESTQYRQIYWMVGNHDFLTGTLFQNSSRVTPILDPSAILLGIGGTLRWLLTHGDAWCLMDTEYQKFRHHIRTPDVLHGILSSSLEQRINLVRTIRQHQTTNPSKKSIDLDSRVIQDWLEKTQCMGLIHGHTHQPADHQTPHLRKVLSPWDLLDTPNAQPILRFQNGIFYRLGLS
ncbi:MAG: UDP-2,3-diacylglucosamine diphosphatase [Gammaproteobacteria bacterium]|nr:UDP-2,3-diacylglucosamine diphosphatase [Gammaproteobacteria bacterium]